MEHQVYVLKDDMDDVTRQEAVKIIQNAVQRGGSTGQIMANIKADFEGKYEPYWHVISGRKFNTDLLKYESQLKEVQTASHDHFDHTIDFDRAVEVNAKFNAETKAASQGKLKEMLHEMMAEKDKRLESHKLAETERLDELCERLDAVLAHGDQFITRDNIDAKLDELMAANVVDYNFMVRPNGKIVHGSESRPSDSVSSTTTKELHPPPSTEDAVSVEV